MRSIATVIAPISAIAIYTAIGVAMIGHRERETCSVPAGMTRWVAMTRAIASILTIVARRIRY